MAIQLKRGNAARWTELNLVLEEGQPGYEKDTLKWKIGDGTTPWNSLPYMPGSISLDSPAMTGNPTLSGATNSFKFKSRDDTGSFQHLYSPAPGEFAIYSDDGGADRVHINGSRMRSYVPVETYAVRGPSGVNFDISGNGFNNFNIDNGGASAVTVGQRYVQMNGIAYGPDTKAQITANQNDYSLENDGIKGPFRRLSSDAARDVTGFAMTYSATHGGELQLIVNVGSFPITLKHENSGSSAANRIICNTGADIVLASNEAADLIYDSTSARWRAFKR